MQNVLFSVDETIGANQLHTGWIDPMLSLHQDWKGMQTGLPPDQALGLWYGCGLCWYDGSESRSA